MKRIISLFLILCCLACSMNMTAFAEKTITCTHCDKEIPKDSNYCCYCGLAINTEENMTRKIDWYEIKTYGHDEIKRAFGDEIHSYKYNTGNTLLLFNDVDSFNLQGKLCIEIKDNPKSKVTDAYWMFEQGNLTTSDYEKVVQQVIKQCDEDFGEHVHEGTIYEWNPLSGGTYALQTARGFFIVATTDTWLGNGFFMLGALPD